MSPASGAIYATNGNKMVYVLPRLRIDNIAELGGGWAGFIYRNTGTPNPYEPTKQIIHPVPISFPNGLVNVRGHRVTSVAHSTLDTTDNWTVTVDYPSSPVMNSPFDGMFKMTLTHETTAGSTSAAGMCGAYHGSRSTVICIAADPDAPTQPVNMIFTSNGQRFAPGTLDTYSLGVGMRTFDAGGIDEFTEVALNDFGRMNLVGTSKDPITNRNVMTIARVNSDGRLDTAFGGLETGLKIVDYNSAGGNNVGKAIAWVTGRKLLVGGGGSNGAAMYPTVLRLDVRGNFDTTFDGDGKSSLLQVPGIGSGSTFTAVAEDSLGRYVGCGGHSTASLSFFTARYLTNGSLDTSFNQTGYALTTFDTETNRHCAAMALQMDDKVIGVGHKIDGNGEYKAVVMRLRTNGTPDVFGTNGYSVLDTAQTYDKFDDVVIQSNGRIVAVGTTSGSSGAQVLIARYYPSGSLDLSFDSDGIQTQGFGGIWNYGTSVALQGNGKIVIAGRSSAGGSVDFAVMRLTNSGALDTTFADGAGYRTYGAGLEVTDEGATSVVIQSDGKIGVIGYSNNAEGTNRDAAIIRLWGN